MKRAALFMLLPIIIIGILFLAVTKKKHEYVPISYTDKNGTTHSDTYLLLEKFEDGSFIVKHYKSGPPWLHIINEKYVLSHTDHIFREMLCSISCANRSNADYESFSEAGFFVKYAIADDIGIVYRIISDTSDKTDCLYTLVKSSGLEFYIKYDCWVFFDFNTRQSQFFSSEEEALSYCKKNGIILNQWYDRSEILDKYYVKQE